jgi:hypothetical protein
VTYTMEDIERAYELGRMAERRKMNDLASIMSNQPLAKLSADVTVSGAPKGFNTPTKATKVVAPKKANASTRAARTAAVPRTKGVKEAITAYLAGVPDAGARIDEIVNTHGFKENSVRGTLMTMKKSGLVRQDGKLWWLAAAPTGNSGAEEAAHAEF